MMNRFIRMAVLCGLISAAGAASAAESALDFNNGSSGVAMATDLYPGLTTLTLSAWIKTSVKPVGSYDSDYSAIAGRGYLGVMSGFGLFLSGSGNVHFQTRDGNDTISAAVAPYPFDGAWHHLAGVYDGSATRLYLDGVGVAEAPGAHANLFQAGVAFGLGARHVSGNNWGFPFTGAMAEVQLWDHALTSAQIQENMFRCLTGAEAGLAGYWPLDDGAGRWAGDRTPAGNAGVIANGTTWLTDLTVAALLPVSRDLSRQGYWPFMLADPETGSTRATDAAAVAVTGFPVPEGCDLYQITVSPSASAINPAAWVSTSTPPASLTLAETAEGDPATLFAWFTNTGSGVPLRRSGAAILYATEGTGAGLFFNSPFARVEMAPDLYPALADLTLSAWIKTSTAPAAGYGAIAGRGYLGGMSGFGLFVDNAGNVYFQTRNAGSTIHPYAHYPFDGKWHHVTGVREGNVTRLYLDGVQVAEETGALSGLYQADIPFGLGARYEAASGGWGFPFTGTIAEVQLWDHASTPAQIREQMFRCLAGTESGLVGYWPLNEGVGAAVNDLVAGNAGTSAYAQWTTDVPFGPMLSAAGAYAGNWPFTLADLETGDARVTDSNVVAVAGLQVPVGYDAYQLSASPSASAINPAAWVSTGTPPDALALAAEAGRVYGYAWFTNTAAGVPLRRSAAAITRYPVEAALAFKDSGVGMAPGRFPALANLTLSAWVKTSVRPAGSPGLNYGAIAGQGYLVTVNGFGLFLDGDAGEVCFQTRNGFARVEARTAYPFDSAWHHLAGVREGDVTRLYVDGELTNEITGALPASLDTAAVAFGLGARHDGLEWGLPFEGSLAEVQLWNHARTLAQVRQDMFSCLEGAESGLLGYWPLSEGEGTAVTDRTDAGNDGVGFNSLAWLTDLTVAALLPASRDPSRQGYWPFTLADLKTGETRYAASNVVAVAGFPVPAGCGFYQISASPAATSVNPGAWVAVPAGGLPGPLQLAAPAEGSPSALFAWFTDTVTGVPLRRSGSSIIYAPQGGPALKFDNASARVAMAIDLYPQLTTLTLSVWIKASVRPPPAGGLGLAAIAGRGYLGDWNGFGLFLYEDGNVYFQTRHGTGDTACQPNTPYPFDGEWHHVAGVFDGGKTQLYLDGELRDEVAGTHPSLYTPGLAFALGSRHAGWGSWGFPFTGALAEVRLWDYARSGNEIKSDRFYRLTGTEAGLIGYWPLDECEGTLVGDWTPAGNDGRMSPEAREFTEDFIRVRPPPGTLIVIF